MKKLKTVLVIALVIIGSLTKVNAQKLNDTEFYEVTTRLGKCVYYDNMKQQLLYREYNAIRNPSITELTTLISKLKAIRTYYNSSHGAIMKESKDLKILQNHYDAICVEHVTKYVDCDRKAKTVCSQVIRNLDLQIEEYERRLGVMKQKNEEDKKKAAKEKKDRAEHLAKRKIEKVQEAKDKAKREAKERAEKERVDNEKAAKEKADKEKQLQKEKDVLANKGKDIVDYDKYLTLKEIRNLKAETKLIVEKDYTTVTENHTFKSITKTKYNKYLGGFIIKTTYLDKYNRLSNYTIYFNEKGKDSIKLLQMWGYLKIKLAKPNN